MNRPLRIAVADDERDMCDYLAEVLPRLGHVVVAVAPSGRQLLEQCLAAPPDLVITDIMMPDMDGFQLAEAVNRLRPTPVLLVSAHHDEAQLARASAVPIMAYLVKPVKEADLKTAVAVAVLRFEQFRTLVREAADLRQALEDRKVIERAKGALMKRMRMDEEEAFRRLRKLSSDRNLKLVEVARHVLAAEEVFLQLEKV
jgi:two-component system, response regulator PdtaR